MAGLKLVNRLLFLIFSIGTICSQSVNAGIYKINFTYGSDPDPGETGGLSGFMVIDTSLDPGNQRSTDLVVTTVPDWITQISLTYDPTPLNSSSGDEVTKTRSTFSHVRWDLVSSGSFDIITDFEPQFSAFGFISDPSDGTYSISPNSKTQQELPSFTEYPLASTATTPGELPLLGLGALYFYYKKLKKSSI